MKMDILFLKTLNPILNLVETKKRFYGKYLYRVKIQAAGIRRHIFVKGDIAKLNFYQQIACSNSFPWNRNFYTVPVDYKLNNYLYNYIINNPGVKYRIEHPYISFYTETETELQDILTYFKIYGSKIFEVSSPKDNTIELLKKNVILVKKINEKYKFKFLINGGVRTKETTEQRQSLMSYLYNLGDEIYPTNKITMNMDSNNWYYNSTYFYCTDEKILLLLKLAYPNLIGKTFQVVRV